MAAQVAVAAIVELLRAMVEIPGAVAGDAVATSVAHSAAVD